MSEVGNNTIIICSKRQRIHELLRQYLTAKRNPEDELSLEGVYSKHYLQRLAINIRAMHGGNPQKTLAYLIQDLDNIRKAYRLAPKNQTWPTNDAGDELVMS